MFGRVTPRSFLWSVSTFAVLIIGIIGCGGDGDDGNDWVGAWRIESVDGQNYEQVIEEELRGEMDVSIVTNNWLFSDYGTLEGKLVIKVEGKTEDGSNISANISHTATGRYSLIGSNYTLTTIFEGDERGFLGDDEDTGTWSSKGDSLTLNSDDGTTIVFKKK